MPTALVLGAGIMGLSAAWGLARAGFSVTVVDRTPPPNPRGASVDHHRLIRHAYGGEALYTRMVSDAFAAWDALFDDIQQRPLVPTGVLALSARGGGWLADSRATVRAGGLPVEDLAGADIARRLPFLRPDGIADGFLMREGGVLLARRIVLALTRCLAARGVAFRTGDAQNADPDHGRITLADGGVVGADLLVVAAGPWAPRLIPDPLRGRVRATRQIIVELEPPAPLRAAWAAAPMLLEIDPDDGFYAVPPVAGTPLKIGDHRFARHGDPDGPLPATDAEAADILALAAGRIAGLGRYRVLGARACHYDVAPDERFVVEAAGRRGFVMSGFSGHGFKFAPLLGLAVAQAARDPAFAAALPGWAGGLAPPRPGMFGPGIGAQPSA